MLTLHLGTVRPIDEEYEVNGTIGEGGQSEGRLEFRVLSCQSVSHAELVLQLEHPNARSRGIRTINPQKDGSMNNVPPINADHIQSVLLCL